MAVLDLVIAAGHESSARAAGDEFEALLGGGREAKVQSRSEITLISSDKCGGALDGAVVLMARGRGHEWKPLPILNRPGVGRGPVALMEIETSIRTLGVVRHWP